MFGREGKLSAAQYRRYNVGCIRVATWQMLYEKLTRMVSGSGCMLSAPFMTLSFMALLVIPELKISDRGLFDGKKFEFTSSLQRLIDYS